MTSQTELQQAVFFDKAANKWSFYNEIWQESEIYYDTEQLAIDGLKKYQEYLDTGKYPIDETHKLKEILSNKKVSYTDDEVEFVITKLTQILDVFNNDYCQQWSLMIGDIRQQLTQFERYKEARISNKVWNMNIW